MDDVARRAKVSRATVSRTITGKHGRVANATALRIHQAAADLGYAPNAVAASLASRRTKTIGLLLPDLSNPFFALVTAGVEATARRAGYRVVIANTDGEHQKEVAQTQFLLELQPDGLIVATSARSPAHLQNALERGVEVVFVDTQLEKLNVDYVCADNRAGAYSAVHHLLELGHRDIGVIRGRANDSASTARVTAARLAVRRYGLRLSRSRVGIGDSTVAGGRKAAERLLAEEPRPTALFVANNLMTVGAMLAIQQAGLTVPGDLSLVAFDDMDWFPVANPPITAVSQDAAQIGNLAAGRVIARLEATTPPAPEKLTVPTRLLVRASTLSPSQGRAGSAPATQAAARQAAATATSS
jgi:LacI family transcriptional regulator